MWKALDDQNSVFCVPTDFVEHQNQDSSVEGFNSNASYSVIQCTLNQTVLSADGVLCRGLMPF